MSLINESMSRPQTYKTHKLFKTPSQTLHKKLTSTNKNTKSFKITNSPQDFLDDPKFNYENLF